MTVQPALRQRIVDAQVGDPELEKILNEMETEPTNTYSKSSYGGLLYQRQLCVPMVEWLRNEILKEAHNSPFAMHPGGTKMYQDIKSHFCSVE